MNKEIMNIRRYWIFLILYLFSQTTLGQSMEIWKLKPQQVLEIRNTKELKLFEKKAKKGDSQAQLSLGFYMRYSNSTKAKKWLLKVSEGYDNNAADACLILLRCFPNVIPSGLYKYGEKATEIFVREGTGYSDYAIAYIYYLWSLSEPDSSKRLGQFYPAVFAYLERAQNKGYPIPRDVLEKIKNERLEDENKSLKKGDELMQEVLNDYSYKHLYAYPQNAMFETIEYYHTLIGYGIEQARGIFDTCRFIIRQRKGYEDEAKWIVDTACKWYIDAAQKGDPKAQYMLGWWYATIDYPGYGMYKKQGEEWFEKSAKKGYAAAQYEAGLIKLKQELYGDAFLWFQRAAVQGDKDGERMLAECYATGKGTIKDINKAVSWYRQAALQGDDVAESSMVTIYKSGDADASKYNSFEAWYANIPSIKEISVPVNISEHHDSPKVIPDINVDINIPVSSLINKKTFAVIIGNENYQRVSKVDFAINDAKIFAAYCQKTLGMPFNNIRIYKDATYGSMMSALKDIKQIAEAYKGNINIIFYYAGHGVPNETNRNAFLLPVDVDGSQTDLCLGVNKLYQELNSLNARSVVVFMDACFSGSQRGEGMLASARGVALKVKNDIPQGNMVVFTAATGDQTAYPFLEKGHGMFTYFLLKKLQETKGGATLGEIGSYVSEQVAQQSVVVNGKSQTPTVISSVNMGEGWKSMKLNR